MKSWGDAEAAEEKDEEVTEWWSQMGIPEDGGWRFGVLGRDHGRVMLVLEVGRSGEEETERELTRWWDLQKQDFSNLMMQTLRCEISDLNSETYKRWDLNQKWHM